MPLESWKTFLAPLRTAIINNWTTIPGSAGALEAHLFAHHQADIVAAEQVLKQVKDICAASKKMRWNQKIALTEARELATAADSASQEASLSTPRAKEALQAARASCERHAAPPAQRGRGNLGFSRAPRSGRVNCEPTSHPMISVFTPEHITAPLTSAALAATVV